MTRLADLIEGNKELLATIDAWDNGISATKTFEITTDHSQARAILKL